MQSWEKSKHPIEEEAVEICTKDVDKDTSDKPETLTQWEIVSEKWLKERLHMLHNEKTCCMNKTRFTISRKEENTRTHRYYNDKNPCRKHSICH